MAARISGTCNAPMPVLRIATTRHPHLERIVPDDMPGWRSLCEGLCFGLWTLLLLPSSLLTRRSSSRTRLMLSAICGRKL